MAQCETCGNDYDRTFEVVMDGIAHKFDCFECAIHQLAPICGNCGCRVLGHGAEEEGIVYCSASCARVAGYTDLRDRGDEPVIEVPPYP